MPHATSSRREVVREIPHSLVFDGTGDYVSFGSNFDYERTQAFSVGMWVLIKDHGTTGTWFGKQESAGNFRGWRFLYNANSVRGSLGLLLNNNGAGTNRLFVRSAQNSVPIGQFVHLVMTYDGSSTPGGVKIYVNTSSIALTTVTNALSATIVGTATANLGGRNDTDTIANGLATRTGVWTRVLTQTDIDDWFFGNIFPTTNLEARYEFTDGSGATLTDSSGNGRDGTITGATWSTTTPHKLRTTSAARSAASGRAAA